METFILEIAQEETPNPETLKFTTNLSILPNYQIDYKTQESVNGESLFADALFGLPFVQSVFLSQNFVTITKKAEYNWVNISPLITQEIRKFHKSGKDFVAETLKKRGEYNEHKVDEIEPTTEEKIVSLLNKYVKPAVEMDGGHIAFHSFTEGVVKLSMQGSCSGCPSSQVTLKAGIEGLLKRMLPEVQEVVAVEE